MVRSKIVYSEIIFRCGVYGDSYYESSLMLLERVAHAPLFKRENESQNSKFQISNRNESIKREISSADPPMDQKVRIEPEFAI